MATVDFIHFCDYAFLDIDGRACLIGVAADLSATAFPFSHASLTVAIGVRLNAGEKARIRAELGPPDSAPARSASFEINGPPMGGPLPERVTFLPFQTVALYFDRPHVLQARVYQEDRFLASKTLSIALKL